MEHALSAAELLNVWERARSLPPTDGALLLMASADAGISREQLAQFSIGRRDAELLRLRERTFRIAHDRPGRLSGVRPADGNELLRRGSPGRAALRAG